MTKNQLLDLIGAAQRAGLKYIFIDNTKKNRDLLFGAMIDGILPQAAEIVTGPSEKIEINW